MSERLLVYLNSEESVAVGDRWGASSLGIAETVENIAKALTNIPENCENKAEEVRKIITGYPYSPYRAIENPKEENFQMVVTIDVNKDGYCPYELLDMIGRDDVDIDEGEEEKLPSWVMETYPWSECVSLPEKIEELCMRYFVIPDDRANYFYVSGV